MLELGMAVNQAAVVMVAAKHEAAMAAVVVAAWEDLCGC